MIIPHLPIGEINAINPYDKTKKGLIIVIYISETCNNTHEVIETIEFPGLNDLVTSNQDVNFYYVNLTHSQMFENLISPDDSLPMVQFFKDGESIKKLYSDDVQEIRSEIEKFIKENK